MPRRVYRRRSSRRSGDAALLIILLLAVLLLVLVENGRSITLPFPNLRIPDVEIPVTGLPRLEIGQTDIDIPITVVPGTLLPEVSIAGTPQPEGRALFGPATKSTGCQNNGGRPDTACTPGAVVNASAEQVCDSGYNPAAGPSQATVNAVYASYGVAAGSESSYPIDHLVPLSLGGSNDPANLWPQPTEPRPGFTEKEAAERLLRDAVCSGSMTLADAQRRIAADWVAVYNETQR